MSLRFPNGTQTREAFSVYASGLGLSGSALITGGYNFQSEFSYLTRFDIATNTFSNLAPLPVARHLGSSVFYPSGGSMGRVFVIGGTNRTTQFSRVDIYDIGTNTWSLGASMPQALYGHTSVLVENNSGSFIYVFGGFNGISTFDSVYLYNITGNTWTTL